MPNVTTEYFHTVALKQRYTDSLATALHSNVLDTEEHIWLSGPTRPAVQDDTDPVRVDRLMLNDGSANPFELSAALMLSHTLVERPQVYLFTLSNGIEAFADRHALLAMLRVRFAAGKSDALFEFERIEGDPFQAQSLAIVDHQVAQVGKLAAELNQMPTLYDASTAALKQQLVAEFPELAIDPETHLMQVIVDQGTDAGSVIQTQSLAQAVFDDWRGVTLTKGVKRRFLDLQGAFANEADTLLFGKAMASAVIAVDDQYAQLLDDHWRATTSDTRTRTALAKDRFKASLVGELYARHHDATLSAKTFGMLRSLLVSPMDNTTAQAAARCFRLTLQTAEGGPLPLAGTFVVQPRTDSYQSLIWFAPDHRLYVFADQAALTAHLISAKGLKQLRPALALVDQRTVLSEEAPGIGQEEILTPLIADRVGSITAMQTRNFWSAIGLPADADARVVMIDDALDIRHLLDPRQAGLGSGRWRSSAPLDFMQVWPGAFPAQALPAPALTSQASAEDSTESGEDGSAQVPGLDQLYTPSLGDRMQLIDARSQSLRQMDNVLLDHALQSLQLYLGVLSGPKVRAGDVRVQWSSPAPTPASASEPLQQPTVVTVELASLLLERVSGYRASPLPGNARMVLGSASTPQHTPAYVIEHMLDKVSTDFCQGYVRAFEQSRTGLRRQGDQIIQPTHSANTLQADCMRLDLALAKQQGWVDNAAFDMVTRLLDRPVQALRAQQETVLTQAFAVSLTYGATSDIVLTDTLIVMQPGAAQGPVMFWTGAGGWQQFSSITRLHDALSHTLRSRDRDPWLECFGERDRESLRTYLNASTSNRVQMRLVGVDANVYPRLGQHALQRQQQDLQQLCQRAKHCKLSAQLFSRLVAAAEVDTRLSTTVDGLWMRVSNTLFEEMLPDWLKQASLEDLSTFRELIDRYYVASDGGSKFLIDVPLLPEYAAERLTAQLKLDFPDQSIDPDQVTVTARHYVNALPALGQLPYAIPAATYKQSESLTLYAINRFKLQQDAALSIESQDPEILRLLTPDTVRKLVRTVDVGSGYLALLRKSLSADDPDYAARKRRFIDQIPSMLLSVALEEKFNKRLSAKGYQFVSRVLETPDGIAREPIDKIDVILSPLRIVADPGMTADTVCGVYLICPAQGQTGPVMLCVLLDDSLTFLECSDQAALLKRMRTDTRLQKILLERMDADTRQRYDHGGFVEPHLPFTTEMGDVPFDTPGPITLEVEPVKGNALQLMFEDTVKLLDSQSVAAVFTNAQEDQAGREFLGLLALEQILMLLPGKLGTLINLWQSISLFKASAVSASGRRWSEALSEFCAALGIMFSGRQQSVRRGTLHERHVNRLEPAGEERESNAGSGWSSTALTVEQTHRLYTLEAKNVALKDMDRDALLNLYRTRDGNHTYAVVNGRVYQVRWLAQESCWTIVGVGGSLGPRLKVDAQRHWQLDLQLRLRGGGGVGSRMRESRLIRSAEETMVIEASGMSEIRLLYRDRARRIGQAQLHAKRLLDRCLDNLHPPAGQALHPEVTRIVSEFFGISVVKPGLITEIEGKISALFTEMMEPSLSPFSSPRYVVGITRQGFENVTAFVMKSDPQRRVFLTEQFFQPPHFDLNPAAIAEGFNEGVHHRAANLIHELTHLVLDTHDIAYLDSMAPYPDLLAQDTPAQVRLHRHVKRLREHRLSLSSHQDHLFTVHENGVTRDLTASDGPAFTAILQLCKVPNLPQARALFFTDPQVRTRVLLGNADSVTMLILLLGRRLLVPPSP